jgi:hypothetical protein
MRNIGSEFRSNVMNVKKLVIAVLSSHLLIACGGSNTIKQTSAPVSPVTPPPSDALVIKSGIVTGFGSIYVDGQRFLSDNAQFTVNGQEGQSIDSLKVGMKISMGVQYSDDDQSPHLTHVLYDNDIEGVITAIDRNNKRIDVAGTTVFYNDLTHFIDVTEMSLSVDDRIEVSGYINGNSVFIATYIEIDDDLQNNDSEYTSGIVSNLYTAQQTFTLQSLTVDYSAASVSAFGNGDKVKVEGNIIDGVFIASEVEITDEWYESELSENSITRVELEGIVSAFDQSAMRITINGLTYTLAPNVEFEGRQTIQPNDFVEVYIDPANNQVTKIEVKEQHLETDGKVKGLVEAIDANNQTITVNGQTYLFTTMTRVEDDDDKYFHFTSLNLNDAVEIAYVVDADSNYVIQRIEREDQSEYIETWELESRIYELDVATRTLTVNGLSVELTNDIRFVINDQVTNIEHFMTVAAQQASSKIEVEGAFNATGAFIVEKVELETAEYESDENETYDADRDDDGFVEFEGKVTKIINGTSFELNGREVRIDINTELEVNDTMVNVAAFMSSLQVGMRLEIEGVWMEGTYIYAYEAEIEDADND